LQSYYHGQTNEALGKKVFYLGIHEDGLLGVCLAILENAKRGKYLSIPDGPLLDWQSSEQAVGILFEHLTQLAKSEKCVFIRLRPQLLDNPDNRRLLTSLRFQPSPMHLTAEHTLQLDLKQTPEQILSQMRKTTRYEIKKAQNLGITVTSSTNPQAASDFYQLQLETAQRQHFIPFSKPLIVSEFKHFAQHNQALLYTAKLENKILAQALIIHYPTESSYHFGASTQEGRRLPGAYAIQWQAIQDAQAHRIPRYNFWGIVDEFQTSHRFYGVSVFKRGFGGQEVRYVPAHDLVIDKIKYLPLYYFETFRRKIRKL
jgi:lipid II:glycine glycyltransferase (peptidoglycan interpeptide bridge formation enzyme)